MMRGTAPPDFFLTVTDIRRARRDSNPGQRLRRPR